MEDRKEYTASSPRSQASRAAVESLAEICSLVPREAERMEIGYEEWLKEWEIETGVSGGGGKALSLHSKALGT